MIFKEFQELVEKAGSRYGLIISVTKRARDLKDGSEALINSNYEKTVSIATKELVDEKIVITNENKEQ